jgi:hypothetical protein
VNCLCGDAVEAGRRARERAALKRWAHTAAVIVDEVSCPAPRRAPMRNFCWLVQDSAGAQTAVHASSRKCTSRPTRVVTA